MTRKSIGWFLVLVLCLGVMDGAEARKKRRRRRYTGPPPTHPVVLWARTLNESTDRDQRRVAAFKLSQYSQPIFQTTVIDAVVKCMKDPDVEIKVLCAKAMAHAGLASNTESIRKIMLDHYNADPDLRQTIVRAFIVRRDSSPAVHDTFLDQLKKSKSDDETVTLLSYFEQYGYGNGKFADVVAEVYAKSEVPRVKRAAVKALADRAHGQDVVIELLSGCADSKDTPLALNCLAGLQSQAKKDPRAWAAIEKTIASSDPDVMVASLDVINAMPEAANPKIALRLVEVMEETDDAEISEKAALALGVVGDQSEATVSSLVKMLSDDTNDESIRIAAALVLGKQGVAFPEKPSEALQKCSTGAGQALKTACQLGSRELESRRKLTAQATTPAVAQPPPPVPPSPATDEKPGEMTVSAAPEKTPKKKKK